MKICIITSSFPMNSEDAFSAAGKGCRDFALELEKAGHEVSVLAPQFSGEAGVFGNLDIRRFSWNGSRKRLSMLKLWNPFDLWEMVRYLYYGRKHSLAFFEENKVDRILSMWVVPGGLFARVATRRYSIPYDVWALGADIWVYGKIPFLKGIVRKVLMSAALVYADGKGLCDDVKMLSNRDCAFLPHLSKVAVEEGKPLALDREKTHFLFVGRWERPKGIDVLIEAVNLLQMTEKTFHLHVIGGGPFEGLIKEKIRAYGLEEKVTLLGWVDQPLLISYLRSCRILVIPSRVESIPCVYSEAMCTGIPVVVTDVGDMGVLTKEHGVGRVARPEDPRSLALEMRTIMTEELDVYRLNTVKIAALWSLPVTVSQYIADVGKLQKRDGHI